MIRLRGHASIALWVGNNEVFEGWVNWAWKTDNVTSNNLIEGWYNDIFNKIIPQVIS